MPGSNPYPAFRIAAEALILVEKGSSERAAVARIVATDLALRAHRQEALSLVLGTLTQLNRIDACVHYALARETLRQPELAVSRLACQVILGALGNRIGPSTFAALRRIGPVSFRPKLEKLLGVVSTLNPQEFWDEEAGVDGLAVRTHYPRWWVEYCLRLLGRSQAIKLLTAAPRPRYIRVNPLQNAGRTSLPSTVKNVRNSLTSMESVPDVYTPSNKKAVSSLSPFYSQGLFQIQDLASFLAVKAADPRPNEKVLDVCAAPGAKTGAMAQLMKNRGTILSVDYSIARVRSWRSEMDRLGVKIATPIVEDASRLGARGSFDLAFVDPPCSGTGILDRNPRMKWRLSPELVRRYSQLQTRILEESARLVGSQGRILYCTCSLTVEENENVVSRFLIGNPDFETRPILDRLGSPGFDGMRDCRRFYPHRDRTAGYFIARLERFK